eukprot:4230835-Amphidinium_carterae.1
MVTNAKWSASSQVPRPPSENPQGLFVGSWASRKSCGGIGLARSRSLWTHHGGKTAWCQCIILTGWHELPWPQRQVFIR